MGVAVRELMGRVYRANIRGRSGETAVQRALTIVLY